MTLITIRIHDVRRRCDAKCYNAKAAKCACICGRTNHGKGKDCAVYNTEQQGLNWLQDAQATDPKADLGPGRFSWQRLLLEV